MLIVEKRYLTMENLHALCVEHGWFTLGSVEESKKLLWLVNNRNGSSRNISTDRLYHIAELIVKHSKPETTEILGVTGVMYCIAERCTTCFTEKLQEETKTVRDWNRSSDISARITQAAKEDKQKI